MKIPSFSQMSLCKSFYYELRARGKNETESRNVGNVIKNFIDPSTTSVAGF